MQVLHRNQFRPLQRPWTLVLLCSISAGLAGCASGPRQSQFGSRGWPAGGGQPPTPAMSPEPLPTPAIPPKGIPVTPEESGPVILPRESVVQPAPYDFAQQQRSRSPARLLAPIIEPRSATPRSLPSIRYSDPPAALSGDVEIVPNSPQVGPLSQEKFFDIVPAQPATKAPEDEPLSIFSNKGYVELPPPPE